MLTAACSSGWWGMASSFGSVEFGRLTGLMLCEMVGLSLLGFFMVFKVLDSSWLFRVLGVGYLLKSYYVGCLGGVCWAVLGWSSS